MITIQGLTLKLFTLNHDAPTRPIKLTSVILPQVIHFATCIPEVDLIQMVEMIGAYPGRKEKFILARPSGSEIVTQLKIGHM